MFNIINALRETVKVGMEKYKLKGDLQQAMEDLSRVMEIAQTMPIPQLVLNAKELLEVSVLEGLTVLQKLRIGASIYGEYRSRKDQCELFPGIKDIISKLAQQNIKMAILTNNKKTYVLETLTKENLAKYFNQVLGFNEVTKTKPNPEGLNKILELEKVKPENAIFIGDMPTDIQAGKNANLRTIAVSSGLSGRAKLESQNPTKVVDNIAELAKLLVE